MELFGWVFNKKDTKKEILKTFQLENDPSTEMVGAAGNGIVAQDYNLVTIPESEVELINTYRNMARMADVDLALTEIRNEVFIFDVVGKRAFDIMFLPDCDISTTIQDKIKTEFVNLYNIIDFHNTGINLFMDWYIDGRLFIYKILDQDNPKSGIRKIIPIDPLKIKKIREVPQPDANGTVDINKIIEYFVYVERYDDINTLSKVQLGSGLKISADSMSYCDSGLYNKKTRDVIGYLYKAIGPYNNLKLMEDSLVIYRVARAPERRIIYVDVGNLPKNKAEQYVHDMMNRFKTKLVYDSKTGNIVDRKNILSMVEDFWLPRRDGKGTEIETLPGGENLGVTEDVEYFKDKFFKSLSVPFNRFSRDGAIPFMFGRSVEIDRDEYRFKKSIDRLRQRFVNGIIGDLLKSQLLLKNIITENDWNTMKNQIQWIYAEDNNFVEYKEAEILANRVGLIDSMDPYVGKYFDYKWILQTVLKYTDKQIEDMTKQKEEADAIAAEAEL